MLEAWGGFGKVNVTVFPDAAARWPVWQGRTKTRRGRANQSSPTTHDMRAQPTLLDRIERPPSTRFTPGRGDAEPFPYRVYSPLSSKNLFACTYIPTTS